MDAVIAAAVPSIRTAAIDQVSLERDEIDFEQQVSRIRHCEAPTGPARSGRPDDRLRAEAIQSPVLWHLDCFASLAMTMCLSDALIQP
jgi:hypothetical protein